MQVTILGLGAPQTYVITPDTTVSSLCLSIENRTFLPSSSFTVVGPLVADGEMTVLVAAEDGMRAKWRKKRMRRLRRKRRKMRQRAR